MYVYYYVEYSAVLEATAEIFKPVKGRLYFEIAAGRKRV